ncbi:helix-turn-helix domain-containing protein [Pseudacidovorax sp. RU35E]|uniref:transcriptional regulator n=1 Tax=Pseudacidovorax sp. RU35E TaxID=1907403 RepID=UPI000953FE1A|nr:helix-turn-helix domain-containing protein [Pseudacidovorax sp. RU35E]SIR00461.1 Putative antitoxin of toxin-antitoxin system, YdaS/YdaT [Pseudacidovorax sp. RU35E]
MNLLDYVTKSRGRQSAIAAAIGCQPVLVSQWANGVRRVPAERCPAIERATGGVVRCEDLRPDVAWDVLRAQAVPASVPSQEGAHA